MKRIFKRNIYLLFGLTALCSGIIGCDDRIDDSVSPVSGQELASANDYGQAEPVLTNAIHINGMPLANIHAYSFPAGKHTLMLPKGYLQVLGFTTADMKVRNAGLAGDEETMDWLFY